MRVGKHFASTWNCLHFSSSAPCSRGVRHCSTDYLHITLHELDKPRKKEAEARLIYYFSEPTCGHLKITSYMYGSEGALRLKAGPCLSTTLGEINENSTRLDWRDADPITANLTIPTTQARFMNKQTCNMGTVSFCELYLKCYIWNISDVYIWENDILRLYRMSN